MKKQFKSHLYFFIALIVLYTTTIHASPPLPTATDMKYVNDYVGILDTNTLSQLISIGKELEDTTSAQSIVVIIPTTDGVPISDYALNLFRTWGIGQKDKDNGLLLLIALNDRTWRVEVGRGLEGALPDALTNRIMESLAMPEFSTGNYPLGILNAYSSFADTIATEYGVSLTKSLHIPLPTTQHSSTRSSSLLITLFLILLLLDVVLNRGRVSSSFLQILFLSNLSRRGGYGGRGGRGNSGGGFGGFGGGSSSGGGSSGQW